MEYELICRLEKGPGPQSDRKGERKRKSRGESIREADDRTYLAPTASAHGARSHPAAVSNQVLAHASTNASSHRLGGRPGLFLLVSLAGKPKALERSIMWSWWALSGLNTTGGNYVSKHARVLQV